MSYRSITYPSGLGETMGIAVTAPSSGLGTDVFNRRFETVARGLEEAGYRIIEGDCLRDDRKHVSGSRRARARDLLELWLDPEVGAIVPPWGGEFLIEILELIDFDRMAEGPAKWIMGYSDISTLLCALTLRTGIATAHGINFMDLISTQNDPLSSRALEILKLSGGATFTQHGSEKFQTEFTSFSEDVEASFKLTEPTEWKLLDGSSEAKFSGRLIGGCIDVISNLPGTPYGDTRAKDNMKYRAVKNHPAKDENILKDQTIALQGRHKGMKLRRVEAWVEVDGAWRVMVFITNNTEWSPRSVCDLYRRRWDIEVFFKQVKQSLKLGSFLGHSANAVRWQVYTALLVYVLLRFMAHLSEWGHSFTRLFAVTRSALWERIDLLALLKSYGTASGRFKVIGALNTAWLPGFSPAKT